MTFEERLDVYKKESDYFLVDIWKNEDGIYDTKRDLTYSEAKSILNRAKKNKKIYRVDIVVEDWDAPDNDCYLFKEVESLVKKAYQWHTTLFPFEMTATAWKCDE